MCDSTSEKVAGVRLATLLLPQQATDEGDANAMATAAKIIATIPLNVPEEI
jgi:hypothetical protein